MNYEQSIDRTFNIDFTMFEELGDAVCYFLNGQTAVIPVPSEYRDTFDETCYYVINRAQHQVDSVPMFFIYGGAEKYDLVCNINVDYLMFETDSETYATVNSGTCLGNNGYYHIDDGTALQNYPTYNPYDTFSNFTYGYYLGAMESGEKCIYDYSAVKTLSGDANAYRLDNLVLRGENVTVYNTVLGINFQTSNTGLSISYGSPYSNMLNQEYDRGFLIGQSDGFVDGYDAGYNDGIAIGGTDMYSGTALGYIGGAFSVVKDIMSLEVLPHINLGLIFSIPLTFILITLIFKLAKK